MMNRSLLALATLVLAGTAAPLVPSVSAQGASEVAGRPALPTTSAEDIFKAREKWGTAPSTSAQAKPKKK